MTIDIIDIIIIMVLGHCIAVGAPLAWYAVASIFRARNGQRMAVVERRLCQLSEVFPIFGLMSDDNDRRGRR